MPDAGPAWTRRAPLGEARWQLVRITRRGVGMTWATCGFWLAMAAVSALAGLRPAPLALFFLIGGALVYPAGHLLNRALGGDLLARGAALRGMVMAIALGQLCGWPVLAALLLTEVPLLAFALAVMLGVHFLPYGWLYRAPGYYALGLLAVVLASGLQVLMPLQANIVVPLSQALLYAVCGGWVWWQNRVEDAC